VRVGWESVPRSRQTRERERERERAKRDSWGICRGRDETREDESRESERKKNSGAWAVPPAAFCWIGFREVLVGPVGWPSVRPSVRRQGLKKGGAKRQTSFSKTCTAFQTLAKPHYQINKQINK